MVNNPQQEKDSCLSWGLNPDRFSPEPSALPSEPSHLDAFHEFVKIIYSEKAKAWNSEDTNLGNCQQTKGLVVY